MIGSSYPLTGPPCRRDRHLPSRASLASSSGALSRSPGPSASANHLFFLPPLVCNFCFFVSRSRYCGKQEGQRMRRSRDLCGQTPRLLCPALRACSFAGLFCRLEHRDRPNFECLCLFMERRKIVRWLEGVAIFFTNAATKRPEAGALSVSAAVSCARFSNFLFSSRSAPSLSSHCPLRSPVFVFFPALSNNLSNPRCPLCRLPEG